MPKFFTTDDKINEVEKSVVLDAESSKHLIKVLRCKIGDAVNISNGKDKNFKCTIKSFDNDTATLSIIETFDSTSEFPFEVVLYQGIAKGEKMDNIIQKAVELGATKIVPVETKFTVVHIMSDNKAEKKVDRWNKIAKEAAKQSERDIIPEVTLPIKYKDAITKVKSQNNSLSIVCYGREDNYNLKNYFEDNNIKNSNISSFSFFIGPEGGFDKEEIILAKDNGINSVSLGGRILRTETASSALLSMLQYELF